MVEFQEKAEAMVGKVGEGEPPDSNETRTLYVKGWCGGGTVMVTTSGTKYAWEMDAEDLRNVREPKL